MIDPVNKRIPRGALFLAFNAAAVLFLGLFVVAPVITHFAARGEEISENASQLLRFQTLAHHAEALMKAPQAGDPFLQGSEEKTVSADLQANLKAVATTTGVRFLGIRGLQGFRSHQLRMVVASLELEGPLSSIRSAILAIENQMPFLFVASATLRSVADGDGDLIRAELKVQGAMRGGEAASSAAESSAQ